MTHNCDRPSIDCRDCWEQPTSADIAETLRAQRPAATTNGAPTFHVQTMQGDIINLGPMPAADLATLFAARRRARG